MSVCMGSMSFETKMLESADHSSIPPKDLFGSLKKRENISQNKTKEKGVKKESFIPKSKQIKIIYFILFF